MAYDNNYSERVELDETTMTEAQRVIIDGLMRDGEFTTRKNLIGILQNQISDYVETSEQNINQDWIDGVNYCIHTIREVGPFHA